VGGVGDLLEAVFSGPDPRPLHAVVHERCDRATAERVGEAFARARPPDGIPLSAKLVMIPFAVLVSLPTLVGTKLRRKGPEPGDESDLTVWLDSSGRARAERSWESPSGPQRRVSVMTVGSGTGGLPPIAGSLRRPPHWPAPTEADVERLFGRGLLREILAGLDLEPVGDGEVAGRPVAVVRAVRRGPDSLWPHWLAFGADSYQLGVDREYGTLLSVKAFDGDTPYEEITVTGIDYGRPVDPALLDA
jgi:hypothetical protein